MEISSINLVYFSATYTTRKIVRQLAKQFEATTTEYDITQHIPETDIISGKGNLLIIGVPVYAGRVPADAQKAISKFKGSDTPAIIVCVYGNREYDDALLELKDIVSKNNFRIVSAGAFIAQHSIFPKVGQHRPDNDDITAIHKFAEESKKRLNAITDSTSIPDIKIKGNTPYKIPGAIPLKPKGNRKCDKCGICVKLCPVQAIPKDSPRKTDKQTCISCGRCIVVCPQKARHFGGILYKIAGNKFTKTNIERKEPEYFFSL